MTESESVALPFGDTASCVIKRLRGLGCITISRVRLILYTDSTANASTFFTFEIKLVYNAIFAPHFAVFR